VKVRALVLSLALTAAPVMFAQSAPASSNSAPAAQSQAQDQSASPGAANSNTMPQSDPSASPVNSVSQSTAAQDDGAVIYGTGMTATELKQAGYNDSEIAQMRNDSSAMVAMSTQPGTASGDQDQAPTAANGVSRPADMNNNTMAPTTSDNVQRADVGAKYAGLWGLLGLLGLLGLAGRSRRAEVRHENDVDVVGRDRMAGVRGREAMRARELAASRDRRDRDMAAASDLRNQDLLTDAELGERDRESRESKIREMNERDRNRRRTA
jgi:hypothetical protein